jgi:hypothetical protein
LNYADALNAIIDDGIEAARLDYVGKTDKPKLDGAIAGFEECRGKSPIEIAVLLAKARNDTEEKFRNESPDYWYWRCRELEIEWVANVLSVMLLQQDLPVIVQPTLRGMLKAMDILGVKPDSILPPRH